MDIKLVDVTVHIDEILSKEQRQNVEDNLRGIEGVVSVAIHDDKPHLVMVEYNPDRTSSSVILTTVKDTGVHAELVGL
ncbi:MAG: heavy metal-associated domain-containing protein [Gammaproteobacteria bacterium]